MTEPIRYRPSWRQYAWPLVVVPAVHVVCALVWNLPATAWVSTGVLWSLLAVEMLWVLTFGVELTDNALVLRGLRKRVVPWRRIDWIGEAPLMGARMLGVRYGGRMRRLRWPSHQPFFAPDPDFDEKARTIKDAWARATSGGSAP